MKAKLLVNIILVVVFATGTLLAQTSGDVIGSHDLSQYGTSPIKGTLSGSCLYCHAPHSGLNGSPGISGTPLWNQKLSSVQSYTVYTSSTMVNQGNPSPPLGTASTLCLSCHDGTVAPGALAAYGTVSMSGSMNSTDVFGTNLSSVHPFSLILPLQSAPDLVSSLTYSPPYTADQTGAVRLINGNVECTSCHNPHAQNIDPNNPNFLVIDNSSSALCLACHTTIPTGSGMGLANVKTATRSFLTAAAVNSGTSSAVRNRVNPLEQWSLSSHATATNRVARRISIENNPAVSKRAAINARGPSLGYYSTVARNGCSSCHTTHNAQSANSLLRGADDQACLTCHNGTSNVSPPASNIFSEITPPKNGHWFPAENASHRAHEDALLNQNRHVTCVDCHNPHSSSRVANFGAGPAIRPSQNHVVGISASDGATVVNPAVNQYENCLRCHGSSTGKQAKLNFGYLPTRAVSAGDPLNIIPQFSITATSSHPVMHDRKSALAQPSLRSNMLSLDGSTPTRSMGVRILCTDCHNSDDNREFGGKGPNGPHGSTFPHILERRYEFSQAPAPGKLITNLFPNPNLSAAGGGNGGPYALCAKCHDLTQILNNSSFSEHARHVKQDGFSCSVCHTSHGMGVQSGSISGERLVNFDANVVAANGATPISYSRATNSCNLVCHSYAHSLVGSSSVQNKARRH